MDGCLACKSCTGGCPIKVDVPGFRAKFLELYHGRYARPVRDHLVAAAEWLLPRARAACPRSTTRPSEAGSGRRPSVASGLVDSPAVSGHRPRVGAPAARLVDRPSGDPEGPRPGRAGALGRRGAGRLLRRSPRHNWVLDVIDLMTELGARPWLAPFRPNGKPLHVHGFLGAFARTAAANAAMLRDPRRYWHSPGGDRSFHDADLSRRVPGGRPRGAPPCCCSRNGSRGETVSFGRRSTTRRSACYRIAPSAPMPRPRCATGRRAFARHGLALDVPAAGLLRHGRHLRPRGRTPRGLGRHLSPGLAPSRGGGAAVLAAAGDRLFLPFAGPALRRRWLCCTPRKPCSQRFRAGASESTTADRPDIVIEARPLAPV